MSIKNIQKYSKPLYAIQEMKKNEQPREIKEDVISEKIEEQNYSENSEQMKKTLTEITKGLNEMVKVFNRKLDFVVHDETNRTMVKIIDTASGKVLREIPPKEILDLVAKMQEAFGIIFDVKV